MFTKKSTGPLKKKTEQQNKMEQLSGASYNFKSQVEDF